MTDPVTDPVSRGIRQIGVEEFGAGSDSGPAAEVRRIAEACDAADGVITLNDQA